jgi:hypothetical protein
MSGGYHPGQIDLGIRNGGIDDYFYISGMVELEHDSS